MKRSVYIIIIFSAGLALSSACKRAQKKPADDMKGMVMDQKPGKDTVNLSSVLKPANEFALASVETVTMKRDTVNPDIDAVGTVAYDMRRVGIISSKVSGRIDKLYIKYRYQEVRKGERVMDIYSPELVTAQQNLLFLLKNDPDNTLLINDAEQRMLLLGMDNRQLQRLITTRRVMMEVPVLSNYSGHIHDAGSESMPASQPSMNPMPSDIVPLAIKEGAYVQKGQDVFDVYDPGKSWILLSIYPADQSKISIGNKVAITSEAAGQAVISGVINYVEPFFRNNTRTLTARVYFDNSKMKLPIGSQVRAVIHSGQITQGTLPVGAVVSLGLHDVVFKKAKDGFKAIKVEAGKTYGNRIIILGGLSPTDTVAANGQFLMDSESFIKVSK